MLNEKENSKKCIYLFSSAQRELYKKDNIDVLCYPQNFVIHFRYEDKYVADSIKDISTEDLKNKNAMVVIVDIEEKRSKKIPKFYPCRKGKIVDIVEEGNVYHFYFKLDDNWVDYRSSNGLKDYNRSITTLNEKPLITGKDQHLTGKFVTFEQFKEDISLSNDSIAWDFIIKKIGELETYKSILFCRIKGIYNRESKTELQIFQFDNHTSGYNIKSNLKYNLEIILTIGNKNIETKDKITIESDDSFFTPIPNEINLGRVDRQDILLSPKPTYSEDNYSKIQIKIKNEIGSTNKVEGFPLVIPFKIEYDQIKLWSSFGVFIGGLLLASGVISSLFNIIGTLDLILKIFGSILSPFAVFWLYKKI